MHEILSAVLVDRVRERAGRTQTALAVLAVFAYKNRHTADTEGKLAKDQTVEKCSYKVNLGELFRMSSIQL